MAEQCIDVVCCTVMFGLTLPDVPRAENGIDSKLDPGTQYSLDIAAGRKRKITDAGHEDSDEDDSGAPPPQHDIYRSRQQKKVK